MRKIAILGAIIGALLAAAPASARCVKRSIAENGKTATALRCSAISPTVHVYVNHHELLVADQLVNTATSSVNVYYGDETVVRVRQTHRFDYRVTVVTLRAHPLICVRLQPKRTPEPAPKAFGWTPLPNQTTL